MTDFPTLSYTPTSEFSSYPSLYLKPKNGTLLNIALVTSLFLVYPVTRFFLAVKTETHETELN